MARLHRPRRQQTIPEVEAQIAAATATAQHLTEEIFTAINEQRFLLDGIITDKPPIQCLRCAARQPITTAGRADSVAGDITWLNEADF